MSANHLKDEYLDVSTNLRHYGSARFALLTLFLAVIAGLLAATFGNQAELPSSIKTMLKVGGILSSVVFFIMEERASRYWHLFKQRAVELEKELSFKQYTNCPEQTLVSSTNAVRLFYILVMLFWLVSFFLN